MLLWGLNMPYRSAFAVILWGIASQSSASDQAHCDYGERHASMPAEFDQYAFMIGDFRIEARRGQGEGWSPKGPREPLWRGKYIMNGMAIMDEWFGVDPAIDPQAGRGVNIRFWDAPEEKWKIAWQHTTDPEVRTLESSVDEDGLLRLYRIHDEKFAASAEGQKIYFEIYDKDHWARITEKRDENGDYKPQLKLEAFRIACGE